MRVAGWLGGLWIAAATGCFHEAADAGDGSGCTPGTLGCPCDGGSCGAALVCEPSIDRCVEADCNPGALGCTCTMGECLGGAVCTDGVCSHAGGTGMDSGTATGTGTTGTSSSGGVTTIATTLTGGDTSLTSGVPVDLGLQCDLPACADCERCGACLGCVGSADSACSAMCQTNAQCEALAACAAANPDPAGYQENCCALPCDKVCGAVFGLWQACAETACPCAQALSCG